MLLLAVCLPGFVIRAHATTVPLAGPGSRADQVDPERLTAIAAACRDQRRLRLTYAGRAGVGTRDVEPHRLVHTPRRWYLLAWDVDRGDWRTFRVDRIADPAPTGARFSRVDPPDAAAFVANSVTAAQYRFRARVLVHAPIQAVAEQVPPTTGMLTADGPDRCLLVTGADSLDLMAFHLARLDADITILDPPELVTRAQALAARLTRATAPALGSPDPQPGPATTPATPSGT